MVDTTTPSRGRSLRPEPEPILESPWPVPWTFPHELSEAILLGGILCGEESMLCHLRAGYCFRSPLRARVARACLEYVQSCGRFDQEEALIRFLRDRRAVTTEREAQMCLEEMDFYHCWLRGMFVSVPAAAASPTQGRAA